MQPTDRKQSMNRIIGYLSVRTKRARYTKEVEREDGNMSITRSISVAQTDIEYFILVILVDPAREYLAVSMQVKIPRVPLRVFATR